MTGVTYQEPVAATLHVHLANGRTWEATPQDLAKFGLAKPLDGYIRFHDRLAAALREAGLIERDKQLTDSHLNTVRYLAEMAICMPELLDHPENVAEWPRIAMIEQACRDAATADPDKWEEQVEL
jgi:hypothetical protein